jgi:hypothetical protein
VIVEFIGPAGVGKSFLSGRVLQGLRARRIDAHNFDLIEIRKTSPRNLLLAARAIYLGLMTKPTSFFHFRRAFKVIARYSIRRILCEEIGGVYITSESLFHRMIRLHRNSRSLGMVQLADLLYRRSSPPDVVVVVEASAEKIFARRSKRNKATDQFSRESIQADIAILRDCIEAMVHVRRTSGHFLRIIRVNAESDDGEAIANGIITGLMENASSPSIDPGSNERALTHG